MWKASAGHTVSITPDDGGADDWETDPDFVVGAASLPASPVSCIRRQLVTISTTWEAPLGSGQPRNLVILIVTVYSSAGLLCTCPFRLHTPQ